MRLLALDTSTKHTGYAYFVDGKLKRSGVIDSDIQDSKQRLNYMILMIYKLLDYVKADMIVFEDVKIINNQHTLVMLQEILGAVIGYCNAHLTQYKYYAPSEWRGRNGIQAYHAKRDELKRLSVEQVKEKYNLDATDDEADAILIGTAYLKENEG